MLENGGHTRSLRHRHCGVPNAASCSAACLPRTAERRSFARDGEGLAPPNRLTRGGTPWTISMVSIGAVPRKVCSCCWCTSRRVSTTYAYGHGREHHGCDRQSHLRERRANQRRLPPLST